MKKEKTAEENVTKKKIIKLNCNVSVRDETSTNDLTANNRTVLKTSTSISGDTDIEGVICMGPISKKEGEPNPTSNSRLETNLVSAVIRSENISIEGPDKKTGTSLSLNVSDLSVSGGGKIKLFNDVLITKEEGADKKIEIDSASGTLKTTGTIIGSGITRLIEASDGSRTSKPILFVQSGTQDGELVYCAAGGYASSTYKDNANGIRFSKIVGTDVANWSSNPDSNYCFRFDGKVYGAVWNDLVDKIEVPSDTELEFGRCYIFDGKKYVKSSKYAEKGIMGINSDTYGFAMGEKNVDKQLNVAVAGYVLAYTDKKYKPGDVLTCGKDGCLTKANIFTRIFNPDRIVATYWKDEENDKWNDIEVNNRNWVKVN